MITALGDFDAEEFFGTGEMRQAIMLFCSVSDSDDAERLENDSARRHNPAIVYEQFAVKLSAGE